MAWTLLLVNTLAWIDIQTVVPIPRAGAQLFTTAALAGALLAAILANPRLSIRPSPYVAWLTVLAVVALASSVRLEAGLGSLVRCFRLLGFVSVIWLLTPWFGRRDLFLARHHLRALLAVLGTVLLGLVIAPGVAISPSEGRLVGAIWPIPAPQVGQYGAILAGVTLTLWANGRMRASSAAPAAVLGVGVILLSHTRTATLGLLGGLGVAGASQLLASARIRRLAGTAAVALPAVLALAAPALLGWFSRGQDAGQIANLTGRRDVWEELVAENRSTTEVWLGHGLSDKSFNGLSIDNGWLATFQDTGVAGVIVVALGLLSIYASAAARPPGAARSCALLIVAYCTVASYTEVGLGDASPYILHLVVAASLVAPRAEAA